MTRWKNCFCLLSLGLGCFIGQINAEERPCVDAFTDIYDHHAWGVSEDGDPSSGWGSHLENVRSYLKFLNQFLQDHQIHSVVDLGCGAFETLRHVNWKNIHYTGVDAVKSVVERDQKKFGASNIQFVQGDILAMDFPDGELMVCKDVLQHLQNADIQLFLSKIGKFKHCLITNDIAISETDNVDFAKENRENIHRGENRPLDLTKPPFNVKGSKIFTYPVRNNHIKQVLYIKNGA